METSLHMSFISGMHLYTVEEFFMNEDLIIKQHTDEIRKMLDK